MGLITRNFKTQSKHCHQTYSTCFYISQTNTTITAQFLKIYISKVDMTRD